MAGGARCGAAMSSRLRTVLIAAALLGCLASAAGCGAAPEDGALPDERFSHGTADVNGTRLHYVRGGAGSAVVLLHGWPQTWAAWRRVMPALADRHTVVAVDLRGVGGSAVEDAGYDKQTLAADVRALVAELGLQDVSVVGVDFGGMVAHAYARSHEDEVRRLVVIEANVPGFGLEATSGRGWHFGFHLQPGLAERLVEGDERWYLERFVCGGDCEAAGFPADVFEDYVAAYAREGRLAPGFELYRSLPQDAEANRVWAAAHPPLRVPVLALGGERGNHRLPAEQMAVVASDVTAEVVPGADHWVVEQHPEAVVAALLRFLG